MAINKLSLHHEWPPRVRIEAINPIYENRMYVSGFFGFVNTTYKKEMVSNDGFKEIWTCKKCGRPFEDEFHSREIVRLDRITNN